jgi:4-hydroxybenzoate polyprenyltransferase
MNIDKIVLFIPIAIIMLMLIMTLIVEVLGCSWNDIFNMNIDSLFAPGIKVIG